MALIMKNTDLLFLNEVYIEVALPIIREEMPWNDRSLDKRRLNKADRKMDAMVYDCKGKINNKIQHLFYWM